MIGGRGAFRNPALACLGRHSYAIYVLHVAITLWARSSITRPVAASTGSAVIGVAAGTAVILVLSVTAATLTARFIEEPCLRLRKHFAVRGAPDKDVPAQAQPGA